VADELESVIAGLDERDRERVLSFLIALTEAQDRVAQRLEAT